MSEHAITIAAARQPVVIIQAGEAMTDSRNVAEYFGKQHKDVLRAIRDVHCSDEFRQRNFAPFKIKDLTGETTSHVFLTKDGFAFVALGFTGAKAGQFKEAYIGRFNVMQAELAKRAADPLDTLSDPASLRTLLLGYAEREIALREQVGHLEPKALALERLAEAKGSLCVTDAAKALQMKPSALFDFLRANRWLFRRPGTTLDRAFQDKISAGLMEHKLSEPDPQGRTWDQVRVTPKGLARLAQAFAPASPWTGQRQSLPPSPSCPQGGA